MTGALYKRDVANYVLAGKATVTVVSKDGARRYTYFVKKSPGHRDTYFVNLLVGPDNTKDYRFIGVYFSDDKRFYVTRQYRSVDTHSWPTYLRMAKHFFQVLDDPSDEFTVYHSGKCGRCGRKLTTPESISRGLGPECCKLGAY